MRNVAPFPREPLRPGDDLLIRHIAGRRGGGERHPRQRGAEQERGQDVVPVADVRQPHAGERTQVLLDGEEVGEALAGVAVVGEAVDHRDARPLGQRDDVVVGEHAGHDGVHIAAEDPGYVGHTLALAELDLLGAQVDGVPAEVLHGHLKGDAGAQRGLLKDHAQRAPREEGPVAAGLSLRLEGAGEREEIAQRRGALVGEGQEISLHLGGNPLLG